MPTLFGLLLSFTAILLIIVVLIQRGRGGGLAGALGGGGGQSAFGSKAGDLFTRITFILAAFWICLCILTLRVLSASSSKFSGDATEDQTAPATPGETPVVPAGPETSGPAEKTPSSAASTAAPATGSAPAGTAAPSASPKPAAMPATPAAK
jgi:preprotein translocase subunit SecG